MPGKHYVYPHMISLEIEAFILARESQERSKNTIIYYRQELGIFSTLCSNHGIDSMEKITPTIIRHCVVDLRLKRSKGGLHAFGRAIKAFLNWFEIENEIENWNNPIKKVGKIGEQNKNPIPGIDPEKILQLISVCGKKRHGIRNRSILYFFYDTGLRVSELCNLNIQDVDLQSGIVQVFNGKGGVDGVSFISTKCKRELLSYFRHRGKMEGHDPLFLSNYQKRLSRRGVDTMLDTLCKKAGIDKESSHDFRRAFTKTTLKQNDMVTTARLLRDKSTSMVWRYAHQNIEDLREAHEKSSPANSLKK